MSDDLVEVHTLTVDQARLDVGDIEHQVAEIRHPKKIHVSRAPDAGAALPVVVIALRRRGQRLPTYFYRMAEATDQIARPDRSEAPHVDPALEEISPRQDTRCYRDLASDLGPVVRLLSW